MDIELRDRFMRLWERYFGSAELPICLEYTDDEAAAEFLQPLRGHACMVAQLGQVRRGKTLALSAETVACAGGKRYLGFTHEVMPDFEHFLSCGIPGQLEGERYKKSPEIVKEAMADIESFEAPGRYAVFKRWDHLQEGAEPLVAIFLASGDVLSGLYTLAGFDETDPQPVIAPFGAGCASIVQYPSLEARKPRPKAVLGMFDVSARPHVPATCLSFAVPMVKLARMIDNMEVSFLITPSWAKVLRRISGG